MKVQKVGGEVDAFCTKCKLTLAHTILAMVGTKLIRVQCNTCRGQHAFRGASAPVPSPKAVAAARAKKEEKESKSVMSFEAVLAGKDLTAAKPYSPKSTYAVDDLVQHPTFGYGFVSAVRLDKVDVTFKFYEKTLVHGRGEGPAPARPAFSRPGAAARPSEVSPDEAAGPELAEPSSG